MARAIISKLIEIFMEENLSKKTDEAMLAVKFADEQAQLYKKKLEESERALFEFKSSTPTTTRKRSRFERFYAYKLSNLVNSY